MGGAIGICQSSCSPQRMSRTPLSTSVREAQQLHTEERGTALRRHRSRGTTESSTGRATPADCVQQMKERKLQLSCRAASSARRPSPGSSRLETVVPVCTSPPPGYLVYGVCVSAIPPTLKVQMQHFAGLAEAYYYTAQRVLEACLYVLYTQMHGRPPSY